MLFLQPKTQNFLLEITVNKSKCIYKRFTGIQQLCQPQNFGISIYNLFIKLGREK